MDKVKYQCKNCGWETSIRQEWGDLRPKRCMNKKCNTSFAAHPDALIITRPEPKEVSPVVLKEEKSQHGKASRKSQKSSGPIEQ